MKVAEAHPDVVVVQQGNSIERHAADNVGTYFGTVYEPVYLAGIAAGQGDEDEQARLRLRLPDPADDRQHQRLPARRPVGRTPTSKTYVVNTSNWCDPAKQAEAAKSLLDQGVDVITQHQDCTTTIIEAAEAAGAMSVGYHADASALAPKGWITGSEWDWGDALHRHREDGARRRRSPAASTTPTTGSGCKDGDEPVRPVGVRPDRSPTRPRPRSSDGRGRVSRPAARRSPGPVIAQDGTVMVAGRRDADYATIEAMDYFVKGVVGTLPTN